MCHSVQKLDLKQESVKKYKTQIHIYMYKRKIPKFTTHKYTDLKHTNTQIYNIQIDSKREKSRCASAAFGAELGWRRTSINCNCRQKLGDMKIQIQKLEDMKIQIQRLEDMKIQKQRLEDVKIQIQRLEDIKTQIQKLKI